MRPLPVLQRCTLALVLTAPIWTFGAVIADPHILMLEDESAERPAYLAFMRGFRQEIAALDSAVVFTENLDLARFSDPAHLQRQSDWLRSKYRDTRIDIVTTGGPKSLAYVLREHATLFPDASLLFVNDGVPDAPGIDMSGIFIGLDTKQALRDALDLVPGTRHLALIVDAIDGVPYWHTLREDLRVLPQGVELIALEGLAKAELRRRVAALAPSTLIFYVRQIRDREGGRYGPSEILEAVAESANAPVFGQLTTQMGHGIVGGRLADPEVMGHTLGRMAVRVVRGERAASIPVVVHPVYPPVFDARQLKRWHIAANRLPADSQLLYREPSLWEERRGLVISVGVALLLQTGLILALLVQYLRRRRAERELRQRMQQIALMNRSAALGEMSAAIAHEVNQPLGSILLNAEAGERLLGRDATAVVEAREILRDIGRDSRRAGAVIERVRQLFRKTGFDPQRLSLSRVARDVAAIARGDVRLVDSEIVLDLEPGLPVVGGDRVQMQQVVLNLVANAADAMLTAPAGKRRIELRTRRVDAEGEGEAQVEIAVTDSGPGLPVDSGEKVFEPFYSTKPGGMGVGLAISRSIVVAHGGTLKAENTAAGGACFRVVLPVLKA